MKTFTGHLLIQSGDNKLSPLLTVSVTSLADRAIAARLVMPRDYGWSEDQIASSSWMTAGPPPQFPVQKRRL